MPVFRERFCGKFKCNGIVTPRESEFDRPPHPGVNLVAVLRRLKRGTRPIGIDNKFDHNNKKIQKRYCLINFIQLTRVTRILT